MKKIPQLLICFFLIACITSDNVLSLDNNGEGNYLFDLSRKIMKQSLADPLNKSKVCTPINTALAITALVLQKNRNGASLGTSKITIDEAKIAQETVVKNSEQFEGFLIFNNQIVIKSDGELPSTLLDIYQAGVHTSILKCPTAKLPPSICTILGNNEFMIDLNIKYFGRPFGDFRNIPRANFNLTKTNPDLNDLMIYGWGKFHYGFNENLGANWIEIPLEDVNEYNEQLKMILIQPNNASALDKTLNYQFEDLEMEFPRNNEKKIARVLLPQFRIKEKSSLEYNYAKIASALQAPLNMYDVKDSALGLKLSKFDVNVDLTFSVEDEDAPLKLPLDISEAVFDYVPLFYIAQSFIGFIVDEDIIHFAFKIIV